MRKSRKKIYQSMRRRKKSLVVIFQIFVICYGSIYILMKLTSATKAIFTEREESAFTVQTGSWWEKSQLQFIGTNFENIEGCPPVEIIAQIKNIGYSMMGAASFEVYYSKEGDPKQNGEKIAEGIVDALEANETSQISFQAQDEGIYKFKVNQRSGFNDPQWKEIWTEQVVVQCNNDEETTANDITDDSNRSTDQQNENELMEEETNKNQKAQTNENDEEKENVTDNNQNLEQEEDSEAGERNDEEILDEFSSDEQNNENDRENNESEFESESESESNGMKE
ncbi:amyloid fiber anchoring/assembly protein TapA [Fervidibacillus albus]|uniref:Amyloid fiber anchoring/assembly protein TapA n=1 Tax=Fervidibacillus albus TaxID=2980026 RepID=A0A9E8LUN6_9BACI|nr:amyloid fiber anchoring/assembly protein TapA [Fervidibacillus albus]WAA10003.1 amyloid fiber anchoring/assembly protein TapA [Fervidibacillus albus]